MSELSPNAAVVVLAYVVDRFRQRVLMLHHNIDPGDSSYGKYNGLSGRMMRHESVFDTAHRIIRLETQAEPGPMYWRGMVHWSQFGNDGHSLLGSIFLVDGLQGVPRESAVRGRLQWVELDKILTNQLPMWPGDDDILPLIFDQDRRPFFGYMPYEGGVPKSWSYQRSSIDLPELGSGVSGSSVDASQ